MKVSLTFSSIATSIIGFFGSKMTYLIAFVAFAAKMPIINAAFPKPNLQIYPSEADVVLAEGTNLLVKNFQMATVQVLEPNSSPDPTDISPSLLVTGGNYLPELGRAFQINGASKTAICGGTLQGGTAVFLLHMVRVVIKVCSPLMGLTLKNH